MPLEAMAVAVNCGVFPTSKVAILGLTSTTESDEAARGARGSGGFTTGERAIFIAGNKNSQ